MKASVEVSLFVLVPMILAGAVNGIVFGVRWGNRDPLQIRPPLPPGWTVAIVWMILFGLVGLSGWYSFRAVRSRRSLAALAVILVTCLAYPFYTLGLNPVVAPIGNTAAGLIVFASTVAVARWGPITSLALLAPLWVWLSFVLLGDAVTAHRCLRTVPRRKAAYAPGPV